MFAVTQEDFVHPIAVIELLWRSCCASESEKREGSLATRLKVRQWTQMLVDHSLLLGSSTEGIHLHDIVLQYLRKRLSAEEMRVEQAKVVEGMVAASRARMRATGRGLQDTGSTAKAFDGEEVRETMACSCAAMLILVIGLRVPPSAGRLVLLQRRPVSCDAGDGSVGRSGG